MQIFVVVVVVFAFLKLLLMVNTIKFKKQVNIMASMCLSILNLNNFIINTKLYYSFVLIVIKHCIESILILFVVVNN